MKRYYNEKENKVYYEGRSLTHHTPNGLFSGVPTEEQLADWGYELQELPEPTPISEIEQRKAEILNKLQSMDYLTSKYIDGEDMSAYGDWQAKRKALREEYRTLEASSNI